MQMSFSAAIARAPMKPFQFVVAGFALAMLVVEGIDLQSLALVTPVIIKDWGIDRAQFGVALAAAMFGMAFGSIFGGMLGDRIGRLITLFLACVIFGLATIVAAHTNDPWSMAAVRAMGGVGFGAGYPNALALASDWVPGRLRTYVIAVLAVGVPVGQSASAALVPVFLSDYGWRGTFVIFGIGSIMLGVLTVAVLREAPGFLLAKGRILAAQKNAARVIGTGIELVPESRRDEDQPPEEKEIGIFHASNARLNWGMAISFSAALTFIYGLSSWATEFLTSSGFTLDQALQASFVLGVVSVIGGISAGWFARRFGSRRVTIACTVAAFGGIVGLAAMIGPMAGQPSQVAILITDALIGLVAGAVSLVISVFYAMMAHGYPQSCRSGGIGFNLTVARGGGIAMVFSGGWLLNLAGNSFIAYFAALAATALALIAAAYIVDRQIEPATQEARPAGG